LLPSDLEDLVLEHLDARDIDRVRRGVSHVSTGLQDAVYRAVETCSSPGMCVTAYRTMFADYYAEALREDAEKKSPKSKSTSISGGHGGGGGDETKTERRQTRSSRGSPTKHERAEYADGEKGDMTGGRGLKRPEKCLTVCLTDTKDIETLIKNYMIDYNRIGAWVKFAQAATESVSGDPIAVSFYTKLYRGQWSLELVIQMPPYILPAYVATDRDAPTWTDPCKVYPGKFSKVDAPQMRALSHFMHDVLARSALPSTNEHEEDENVTLSVIAHSPWMFEYHAPRDRIPSDHVIRVFARIVAAVAYAFASVVILQYNQTENVESTQTEETYRSPIPTHIEHVRRAFPTLPIRVLYYNTDEGRAVASHVGHSNPRTWPTLSIPDAVRVAAASGVNDVVAVKFV
jgi:hypothetical protein